VEGIPRCYLQQLAKQLRAVAAPAPAERRRHDSFTGPADINQALVNSKPHRLRCVRDRRPNAHFADAAARDRRMSPLIELHGFVARIRIEVKDIRKYIAIISELRILICKNVSHENPHSLSGPVSDG
jgi:hypothetical protein